MAYPQTTFSDVAFDDGGFWKHKRKQVCSNALQYQLKVLKETGRYDAFKLEWHDIYNDPPEIWPVPKHLFWDSDVAKWIEGACYFLHEQEDATVRASVDELVDMIAAAQQSDGYLNIHYTVVEPGKRFTNLRDMHELYNAGHLIEAALAHEKLFKNGKLIGPIIRYANFLSTIFGPGSEQRHGYPGHPEIELALLRLHEFTRDERHLSLARYFLTERGNPVGQGGSHYYDVEAHDRNESRTPDYFPAPRSYWYQQAHAPILRQQTIEGHSVRAMYLLTALADLVRQDPSLDSTYETATKRLWFNMTNRKMYLTGGIGTVKQWEGFGPEFFLPQGTDEGGCYAETCASIGVMMLADRLFQVDPRGHYGDVMELCLYNSVLTGVSCNGREWTYVNQLASSDMDPSQRSAWFTVACCPPNVLRLLGMLGGYMFSVREAPRPSFTLQMFASMTISATIKGEAFEVKIRTDWPRDGQVDIEISALPAQDFDFAVRRPEWSKGVARVGSYSADETEALVKDGLIQLPSSYLRAHRKFTIEFPMKARTITSHEASAQNIVALARGPIVYCVEDVDNSWVTDHFKSTCLSTRHLDLQEEKYQDHETGEDIVRLIAKDAGSSVALEAAGPEHGLDDKSLANSPARDLVFVPYYFRANRKGRGQMRVGLVRRR